MRAEIIAVGSELLTPDFVDTNSLFLTQGLHEVGFEVRVKTIVGDDAEDMAEVLRAALGRSRLVLTSGGLGPTEDDMTRSVVARVLGRGLRKNPAIADEIRRRFESRGYKMAPINERQAEVIEGAEVLANPLGTAPGQWIDLDGRSIALLPGPPRELRPMFEGAVLPRIRAVSRGRRLVERRFSITGMTESEVDALVAPVYTACQPRIATTILALSGHIALRCRQWLAPEEEPGELDALAARMREMLGRAVFSTSDEPMEGVVARILGESKRTIAVAESCTAGLLGSRLTRIPGSSSYFLGGVLAYSNEAKVKLCGVPQTDLDRHGAVSPQVAEALARGALRLFGASVGVSVTGIAGPAGGSAEKPVGLVYVGLADAERCSHHRRIIPGDRDAVRERAVYFTLSALRNFLEIER